MRYIMPGFPYHQANPRSNNIVDTVKCFIENDTEKPKQADVKKYSYNFFSLFNLA